MTRSSSISDLMEAWVRDETTDEIRYACEEYYLIRVPSEADVQDRLRHGVLRGCLAKKWACCGG